MVFSSLFFLILFFPVTVVVYYLLPKRLKNLWLATASIAFYAAGETRLVFLFLAEILWNWAAALALVQFKSDRGKKLLLIICLLGDLGVLALFKYSRFFIQCINDVSGAEFMLPAYILPIGISFYTFQAISYVVDVFKGDMPRKNPIDIALYLAFFPQLIAGPIVRFRLFSSQLSNRRTDWEMISGGFIRFCTGLCKKVLLANQLGILVDWVFDSSMPETLCAPMLWLGSLAYSLQLFFDFSGYSDMAVGLGAMFGFRLPENFNNPYLARTAKDFWTRWHITLSAWFREYVYIPLGGSFTGQGKTIRNILIVWTLTGLWHGANWTFLLWGFCWGMILIVERFLFRPDTRGSCIQILYRIFLGIVIVLLWTIFRSQTVQTALVMLGRMFSPSAWSITMTQLPMLRMWWHEIWLYYLASLLVALCIPQRLYSILHRGTDTHVWTEGLKLAALACCMILSFSFLVNGSYDPFLYFQF